MRLKHQEVKLEELGPQIDAAKQKLDFFNKDYKGRLGDYLNDPENAQTAFRCIGWQRQKRQRRRGC